METILKNLEADIATVEQYLKELRAGKARSTSTALAKIRVYEGVLFQLMQQRREVKKYIEEAKK